MNHIFEQIRGEVERQYSLWGEQNHPSLDKMIHEYSTPDRMCLEYEIPTESRAKELNNSVVTTDSLTWGHIAVEELSEAVSSFDVELRRKELIQLAAVVVSWIDSIDRNEIK